MEKQNAKRRDSQSENRSDALKESHSTTTEKYIFETVDKLLDRKLETVAEILGESVLNQLKESNKSIDDKLKEVINENKLYAETVKGSRGYNENQSNTVTDFMSILDETKNIIIYGLEEKHNNIWTRRKT